MMGRHSRTQFSSIAERLARACAHGTRQLAFVNELLAGTATRDWVDVTWKQQALLYGRAQMDHSSFVSLRRRLTAVGFIVTIERGGPRVTLTFPEEAS